MPIFLLAAYYILGVGLSNPLHEEPGIRKALRRRIHKIPIHFKPKPCERHEMPHPGDHHHEVPEIHHEMLEANEIA